MLTKIIAVMFLIGILALVKAFLMPNNADMDSLPWDALGLVVLTTGSILGLAKFVMWLI
jgi:nitrate reductase gamma subunit